MPDNTDGISKGRSHWTAGLSRAETHREETLLETDRTIKTCISSEKKIWINPNTMNLIGQSTESQLHTIREVLHTNMNGMESNGQSVSGILSQCAHVILEMLDSDSNSLHRLVTADTQDRHTKEILRILSEGK